MRITVKLMGVLKEKTPRDAQLELDDPATIAGALEALEIPAGTVHVFLVNNNLERDTDRALAADDELTILPPVGGG